MKELKAVVWVWGIAETEDEKGLLRGWFRRMIREAVSWPPEFKINNTTEIAIFFPRIDIEGEMAIEDCVLDIKLFGIKAPADVIAKLQSDLLEELSDLGSRNFPDASIQVLIEQR
ncbi:MAG TPA: hypothetical protein VJI33_04810 [Candidatus Paceibacterota bacterium]